MDAKIDSPQYGHGEPMSVFYLKDGAEVEHVNPDGNLNYRSCSIKRMGNTSSTSWTMPWLIP